MKEKELKNFDILDRISKMYPYTDEKNRLFWYVDGGMNSSTIDLTKTSGNLCFTWHYKPTGEENIYFDCYIEDWTTRTQYSAGYIYFKTYTGYLTPEALNEIAKIEGRSQQILKQVYKAINAA